MIDYAFWIWLINFVAYGLFILMIILSWYYLASFFISGQRVKPVPHSDKKTHFAVIVPARWEARVIKNTLQSFKKQTYNKKFFDVWVIVESEKDPTTLICKHFGYKYFVRKDLVGKQTKGYAIQELHNYFMENDINYDAYMIIDAGNVLSNRYIEIMNDLRQTGVRVGLGYRNYTNASQNWMTCASAVFFSYMMSFTARMRTNLFQKTTLCGTGLFVDVDIIKEAGGWKFTGMTEDTQLTAYCYYHDVKMRYYPLVEFYDEQASTLKANHAQKVRWIWGYFENRKHLHEPKDLDYKTLGKVARFFAKLEYAFGVYPFAVFSALNFLLFAASLILSILSSFAHPEYSPTFLGLTFSQFGILWGSYMLIALLVIIKDNKHLKFNFPTIIWTMLTYILFFVDIVAAIFDGLFHKKKRKSWARIEHTGKVDKKVIK